MKKILILTSGPAEKIKEFAHVSKDMGIDLTIGSFYDISWEDSNGEVRFQGNDISSWDLIYFRLVGKSLETAALVAECVKDKGVKLIDEVYGRSHVMVTSVSKYLEYYKLAKAVVIPPTYFASISSIKSESGDKLGYPFVIKSTSGRKSRDVWLVQDDKEDQIFADLKRREVGGDKFFAQKYIPSTVRIRILVIGNRAVAGITQPSKYLKKINPEITDEEKEALKKGFADVPPDLAEISLKAARSVDLNISGVDILQSEIDGKYYVIEANAAPAWRLVNKYCDINVEKEILEYLKNL